MNRDIIRLDKYTFKFEDIDLIYPVYIRDKSEEKYYSLYRVLSNSNYSRKYQLNNRSTQAQYFDLLLDLDYFRLLGIDYNFITEMVLINTRPDIDSTRSYYLLDYFIPDLSLCIELDSDYHDPIKDKLKDQFLTGGPIDEFDVLDHCLVFGRLFLHRSEDKRSVKISFVAGSIEISIKGINVDDALDRFRWMISTISIDILSELTE